MQTEFKPQTHYQRIGGDEKVRALVQRFYQLMDELPEAYGIRKLHAEDLQGATDKLFKFLTGWMGGPQLYVEQYGHPMLRARHLPFGIGADRARPVAVVHEPGTGRSGGRCGVAPGAVSQLRQAGGSHAQPRRVMFAIRQFRMPGHRPW